MANYKQGGYEKKYNIRKIVQRVDGSTKLVKTDPEADYFVLRLDKDPHARKALIAYMKSVSADNKQLADDLKKKLINEYGENLTEDDCVCCKDWINISEKMPNERCLLQTTSKMIVIGDWYKRIWRVDGATYWENKELKSNYNTEDITHWMPLPEVCGG